MEYILGGFDVKLLTHNTAVMSCIGNDRFGTKTVIKQKTVKVICISRECFCHFPGVYTFQRMFSRRLLLHLMHAKARDYALWKLTYSLTVIIKAKFRLFNELIVLVFGRWIVLSHIPHLSH